MGNSATNNFVYLKYARRKEVIAFNLNGIEEVRTNYASKENLDNMEDPKCFVKISGIWFRIIKY